MSAVATVVLRVVSIALGILIYRFVAAHADGWGTAAFVVVCILGLIALSAPKDKRS